MMMKVKIWKPERSTVKPGQALEAHWEGIPSPPISWPQPSPVLNLFWVWHPLHHRRLQVVLEQPLPLDHLEIFPPPRPQTVPVQ